MDQSSAESMHAYLTRENAIIDSNGLSIPRDIPVQQYRAMRNRGMRIVPCSAFGAHRHSR